MALDARRGRDRPDASPGETHRCAERLSAAWGRASARHGVIRRGLRLAGRVAELGFAGPALLEAQGGAVGHLLDRQGSDVASARLRLFHRDPADPLVEPPAINAGVPLAPSPPGASRVMQRLTDGRIEVLHEPRSGVVSLHDAAGQRGVFFVPRLEDLPVSERVAPWRILLHRWLRSQGLAVAHSAAVSMHGGALLLPGPSGAGKSTLALACLLRGHGLLADDTVVLEPGEPCRAHRLYRWGKVSAATLSLLPALARLDVRAIAEDGKLVVETAGDAEAAASPSAPIRAVVVPDRAGSGREVERISPARALRALAPTSLLQLRGADRTDLAHLATVVGSVPCYRLAAGDLVNAVASLEALAWSLAGRHPGPTVEARP